MRTQSDYLDVLQLQKFQAGQHVSWKPFVMTLLGFDEKHVSKKYYLDKDIEQKEEEKKKKEQGLLLEEKEASRMAAELRNLKSRLEKTEKELDGFEFSNQEKKLMHELVDEIETRISDINDELYNIQIDIKNIDRSLKHKLAFKVDDIDEIFKQSNIHFSDQIKKSYEELVEFNKSITRERNFALRKRKKILSAEQAELREERVREDRKRQQYHDILSNTDSLEKFKALQRNLTDQKAELTYLQGQYDRLQEVNELESEINSLKRSRSGEIDTIRLQITKDVPPRERVAKYFNEFCERVLDHEGLFYLEQNTAGNVEFRVELKEVATSKTSRQSEGKSYKQLLCALFDLALLKSLTQNSALFIRAM